jgi:hypothetical protein
MLYTLLQARLFYLWVHGKPNLERVENITAIRYDDMSDRRTLFLS